MTRALSYENLPLLRVASYHTPLYIFAVIYHKVSELFDAVNQFY